MTTTSTYVGFDENARVSSRVLKPPGGGSSISFGEDDVPVAKPQPKAQALTPAESSNGSESPQAETSPASAALEAPSSPPPSSPSSSNGTDTNGNAAPPNTPLLVEQFPKINIDSPSSRDSNGSSTTTNGTTNGTSEVNGSVKESGEVNGKANGTPEPKECAVEAAKGKPEAASNGNHTPSSPASSPSAHSPGLQTATSSGKVTPAAPSTPTSSGGCSPDTRDRLFGYHDVASKPHVAKATPSNHHMRSSIFTGHDEDTQPSNGCSASRPTTAPPAQPKPQQQQPPTRVRQPPGGYSTKLW